jgi:hypothetical protein
MILNYLDILSDPLTLHYETFHSHTSIPSSILSIIATLACIALGAYSFLDVIKHLHPTSFCYTRQEYDVGDFPINESSMFHFFKFEGFPKNENLNSIMEIFGFMDFEDITINYKDNTGSRLLISHYTYDICPEKSEKYKLNHINELIKEYSIVNGYCISGFYNKTSDTYIPVDSENFPYPIDEKGTSHPNYTSYQIIIQSCENDTFHSFNNCKPQEYIDKVMTENIVDSIITMLTQEVDVSNYENPIINKFFQVRMTFAPGSNVYSVSNLNFQPLRVMTYSNVLFDNKYTEDYSYYFEQNDLKNFETKFNIYTAYQFWMQNKVYIYERSYKRIQNFFADIGGTIKTVTSIAKILNFIFCKYQTFFDIEKIMHKRIDDLLEKPMNKAISQNKVTSLIEKEQSNEKVNQNESNFVLMNNFTHNPTNEMNKNINTNKNIKNLKRKNSKLSFSYIKENRNVGEKIGLFSAVWYQFFHSNNKVGKYVDIVKWYYRQVISEQNMFDLYFFCHSIEKNDKIIFDAYQFEKTSKL